MSTRTSNTTERKKLKNFVDTLHEIKQDQENDEYLGLDIVNKAIYDLQFMDRRRNSDVIEIDGGEKCIDDYYTFDKDLGCGKYGIVKSAYSKSSPNYEVAVKIINLKLIKKKYHYLAQEIVALKQVDHPNIIKILEIYKQQEKIYIVMEKVKGVDLLDYLFSIQSLSENQAAVIIKQVLKAIKHLNSLKLVHRDIKLENIMIEPETMHIKLIDFGFSSFYFDREMMHTQVGTPYYISPQVLKGEYGVE